MSAPNPIGAIGQILSGERDNPADKLGWFSYKIEGVMNARSAGQWCNINIVGDWTFKAGYKSITFCIKEKTDAMRFKLTWVGI